MLGAVATRLWRWWGGGTASGKGREPALDGIRGFAFLMVILIHCFYMLPTNPIWVAWDHVAKLGWFSIDLFFVLSGYLITRILIAQRGRSGYFGRFYMRRVFRIFPAFYVALALIWLLLPLIPQPPHFHGDLLGQWPYFVSYMQNWGMALNPAAYDWPGTDHFWSLANEEQFYLLWPLVVAACSSRTLRRVCLCLVAVSILVKFGMLLGGESWRMMYATTFSRIEGIAGGALLATLTTPELVRRWRPWIVRGGWVGTFVLLVFVISDAKMTARTTLVWAIPAASAVCVWVMFAVQHREIPLWVERVLSSRVLVWLGFYSYGFYVIHYPIYWVFRVQFMYGDGTAVPDNADVVLTGVLTIIATIVFGRLMYALVDAPAARVRDRLQRRIFSETKVGVE